MNVNMDQKEFARSGGLATLKKYGADHFRALRELRRKKEQEKLQKENTSNNKDS